MNCRKINNLLSAYLDGELAGVEQLLVRQHLRDCEACNDEYESLLMTKRLLANLALRDPAPDFEDRLLRRIHATGGRPAAHAGFFSWWSVLGAPQRHRVRLAAMCSAFSLTALCLSLSRPQPGHDVQGAMLLAPPTMPVGGAVAPAAAREYREYLYVHSPYAWDDGQPSPVPSHLPATGYTVPVSAQAQSAIFGDR